MAAKTKKNSQVQVFFRAGPFIEKPYWKSISDILPPRGARTWELLVTNFAPAQYTKEEATDIVRRNKRHHSDSIRVAKCGKPDLIISAEVEGWPAAKKYIEKLFAKQTAVRGRWMDWAKQDGIWYFSVFTCGGTKVAGARVRMLTK